MADDEEVDIVDEWDRVQGRATRREMRARNLRHRAVYILVFRSTGEIFVHRRTSGKDVFPSFYDVAVGGVVAAGETYEEAATREVAEEIGAVGVVLRSLGPIRFDDATNRVNGWVYVCRYDGPLNLQGDEIVSGEWLAVDTVRQQFERLPFCPDGLEALKLYQEVGRSDAAGR